MASSKKSPAKQNAERLIVLLPQLLRGLLKREDNFITQGKITLPQMLALEHLLRKKSLRMSELAEALSIQTASATGLVDRMIRLGYIKRSQDPQDRRVVRVALTQEGKRIVERIFEQKKKVMIDVFSRMPASDSRQYVNVLERIVRILSEERGGPKFKATHRK